MNIYNGCIDNHIIIYDLQITTFTNKLDNILQKNKENYKIVFVDISNSILYGARVVLYNRKQKIPFIMQNYKYKWIKQNNKWVRENLVENNNIIEIINSLKQDGITLDNIEEELNYRDCSGNNRWDDNLYEYSNEELSNIEQSWVKFKSKKGTN